MKNVIAVAVVCGAAVLSIAGPGAAEAQWSDHSDVALTLGALNYVDAKFHDGGPILGLEGRTPLAPGWLIGASIAGGSDFVLFGDELSITPLEANVTRLLPLGRRVAAGFGGGLAAVRGRLHESNLFADDLDTTDWVFGGQVFGGLDWVPGRITLGVNLKYQATQELADFGWGLDNWRIVARVGAVF